MENQTMDGRTLQIVGAVIFAIGAGLAVIGTTSTALFLLYGVAAIAGALTMNHGRKRREEERRTVERR